VGNGDGVSVGRAVSVEGIVEEGRGVSVGIGGGVTEEQEVRRKKMKEERRMREAMCWHMGVF